LSADETASAYKAFVKLSNFFLVPFGALRQRPLSQRCRTVGPMGFYAPAQLVFDAGRNGVQFRPADVQVGE